VCECNGKSICRVNNLICFRHLLPHHRRGIIQHAAGADADAEGWAYKWLSIYDCVHCPAECPRQCRAVMDWYFLLVQLPRPVICLIYDIYMHMSSAYIATNGCRSAGSRGRAGGWTVLSSHAAAPGELLTCCMAWPTQHPTPAGREMSSSLLSINQSSLLFQ